jgi:hypothetical protein
MPAKSARFGAALALSRELVCTHPVEVETAKIVGSNYATKRQWTD